MSAGATNITWHHGLVPLDARERAIGQRGAVLWLTGLSGSGKSTIARELERALIARGRFAYVLDGDNLRHGLCADLGFSDADRAENIRRVGAVAQLFADAGALCITAFISPFRADRDRVRALLPPGRFWEIHVQTPIEECERRDPKGLYRRARAGEIADFTGISSPYEAPANPELAVPTVGRTPEQCAASILAALQAHDLLPGAGS